MIDKISEILKNGGVGVLPTDTIYGIVASALNKKAVLRIYKLRKRNPKKPLIILISSLDDLVYFGIKLNNRVKRILKKLWPGKVSVILPCPAEALREGGPCLHTKRGLAPKAQTGYYPRCGVGVCPQKTFAYLHRGTKTLAFRLPAKKELINLLKKTGPLVAPSANIEGFPPAHTIKEAKKYFEDKVDFYADGGSMDSLPSTIVRIEDNKVFVEREGAVDIEKIYKFQ